MGDLRERSRANNQQGEYLFGGALKTREEGFCSVKLILVLQDLKCPVKCNNVGVVESHGLELAYKTGLIGVSVRSQK